MSRIGGNDQEPRLHSLAVTAEQVALFPRPKIQYTASRETPPTPELPYGALVDPTVISAAARATEDVERLAQRVAKANKAPQ